MRKVLILLSTYNGEKYLPEQIESLLKQKNVDLHILVRDDGSKDKTIEYLEKLSNQKIEYYKGENKGAVGSFLDLINSAPKEYEYYAFCDQDDFWLDDKIEKAIEKLDEFNESKPSLYYSGQIITDEKLNVIYHHNLDTKRSIKANCIFNQVAGCTVVFNRELLIKLKQYMPKNIYMHDVWCYRVCAALSGNIAVESVGHIYYRQHGDNVVGLQNSLGGKMKRAKAYVFTYNASSYAEEILKGYAKEMSSEWRRFWELVASANTSIKSRFRILTDSAISFNDKFLRILFTIKVLIKKL